MRHRGSGRLAQALGMFNFLPQIHDARLVGYVVDGEAEHVTCRLRPESNPENLFLLRFEGVYAYSFKHANLISVLANIYEVACEELLSQQWPLLLEGMHSDGWPEQLPNQQADATHFIKSRNFRAFVIESSIGISGWVLATSFSFLGEHA